MDKYQESLKRLKQETIPATYMPDFDKDEHIENLQEALNTLEFLIKHLYVAPELLELRVAPKHNFIFNGHRFNGIKVQDDEFWNHIKVINKLKKEVGSYE